MQLQRNFDFLESVAESGAARWRPARKIASETLARDLQSAPGNNHPMHLQASFDFKQPRNESGYTQWLAARQIASEELARRLHLPVGHLVEVWLTGEIYLRGKLRLKEQQLFISEDAVRHLELVVDDVPLRAGDIDRCLRLD